MGIERLPAIVTTNYAALADQYNLGTQTDDTHDIAINASKLKGAHTIRFGFGYRVLRQNLNSLGPLSLSGHFLERRHLQLQHLRSLDHGAV